MTKITAGFRYLVVSIAFIFTLGLTACHNPAPPPTQNLEPHPLTPYEHSLVSDIQSAGAQVIKQGEVMQIVMPADTFFYTTSWKLRHRELTTIHRIASLVKSYTSRYQRPRIIVAGYTDTVFAKTAALQISKHMASTIAAHLWDKGVPHRWISIKAYGAKNPIASNQTSRGAAKNRRVVIKIN
jgi:outer membrane protein OmpA-like peptidoglycan-associated protein